MHGVLQRTTEAGPSQCRAIVLAREDADVLLSQIHRNVRRGGEIYTDDARAYGDLVRTHAHAAIDHSREYVRGNVHTNGLENFWSLFKRSINGTYVAIAPFHLFRYVAEQCQRFNSRKATDADRFRAVLSRVFGRRLTWRVLTGADGAGFMSLT
ncbi:MAG: transposase [Phycisphaerales bacterium]|nr:transposase [Phycisphaerales bacterium]